MLTRKVIVKGLKESADLVFVGFSPREYNDSFAKVKGRMGCQFIICKLVIFSNVPWKLLGEEVPLQTLVHTGVQSHVDKPPRASRVTDGFTQQKLLSYLVNEMIGGTQEVSAKGESGAIG
jgi:hypothetical protein